MENTHRGMQFIRCNLLIWWISLFNDVLVNPTRIRSIPNWFYYLFGVLKWFYSLFRDFPVCVILWWFYTSRLFMFVYTSCYLVISSDIILYLEISPMGVVMAKYQLGIWLRKSRLINRKAHFSGSTSPPAESSPSVWPRTEGPVSGRSGLQLSPRPIHHPRPLVWVRTHGPISSNPGLHGVPRPQCLEPRPICFFLAQSRNGQLDLVLWSYY